MGKISKNHLYCKMFSNEFADKGRHLLFYTILINIKMNCVYYIFTNTKTTKI